MQDWYKLTILKRKGFLIPFFIFIFLLVIVYARDYTQDYNNALTRSIADAIYCKIGGSCGVAGGANLSGVGKADNIAVWYNTTHLTYNTSAIGGGSSSSSNYYPKSIMTTAITYDGSLVNGTLTGYRAGNAICQAEYTDSNMCSEFEVMAWYAHNQSIDLDGVETWVITGSPKYIPATVPVNDCNGYTYDGIVTYLGNYWHFDKDTGGDGRALNCATAFKLACCIY